MKFSTALVVKSVVLKEIEEKKRSRDKEIKEKESSYLIYFLSVLICSVTSRDSHVTKWDKIRVSERNKL